MKISPLTTMFVSKPPPPSHQNKTYLADQVTRMVFE